MGLPARFVALLAAVSALLPLAGALLVSGVRGDSAPAILGGVIVAAAGLVGLAVLVRVVVVMERRRGTR
jgi:hypothetical protein